MRLESDTIMNVWFGKEKLSAGYGSTWHRHEGLGSITANRNEHELA